MKPAPHAKLKKNFGPVNTPFKKKKGNFVLNLDGFQKLWGGVY